MTPEKDAPQPLTKPEIEEVRERFGHSDLVNLQIAQVERAIHGLHHIPRLLATVDSLRAERDDLNLRLGPVEATHPAGRPIRIAFDVGGVLSKRPEVFIPMMRGLAAGGAEVYVLSDVFSAEKVIGMLALNDIELPTGRVISADYQTHAELCKTRVCKELGIDILIDDFIGYVSEGDHVRLLMMPDASRPYYAPTWKTDGTEGDFGRRTPTPSAGPSTGYELRAAEAMIRDLEAEREQLRARLAELESIDHDHGCEDCASPQCEMNLEKCSCGRILCLVCFSVHVAKHDGGKAK